MTHLAAAEAPREFAYTLDAAAHFWLELAWIKNFSLLLLLLFACSAITSTTLGGSTSVRPRLRLRTASINLASVLPRMFAVALIAVELYTIITFAFVAPVVRVLRPWLVMMVASLASSLGLAATNVAQYVVHFPYTIGQIEMTGL